MIRIIFIHILREFISINGNKSSSNAILKYLDHKVLFFPDVVTLAITLLTRLVLPIPLKPVTKYAPDFDSSLVRMFVSLSINRLRPINLPSELSISEGPWKNV
ncbi:MAG: hypothetical protein HQL02_05625 [Nitrospirae bacterium]|nr:hypothetical protein [Nitrospirota bacterium]